MAQIFIETRFFDNGTALAKYCLSQLSVSINSRVVLSQNRRVMRPK